MVCLLLPRQVSPPVLRPLLGRRRPPSPTLCAMVQMLPKSLQLSGDARLAAAVVAAAAAAGAVVPARRGRRRGSRGRCQSLGGGAHPPPSFPRRPRRRRRRPGRPHLEQLLPGDRNRRRLLPRRRRRRHGRRRRRRGPLPAGHVERLEDPPDWPCQSAALSRPLRRRGALATLAEALQEQPVGVLLLPARSERSSVP